ncbi:MAG: tRNA (adenosine(37)-N6)-threonylcarbamoyltransferase complex ATPase subunit type 1 TsaE [Candidatus Daviesbacteria bacterium]|nr:tRNA (adenosine(37)-N6)-threonylcarbamoyltransferase complex ATPase subunit type 1 TsaE [Candidatus Daviesbacteria bacterium]
MIFRSLDRKLCLHTSSAKKTQKIAFELAQSFKNGGIIALKGDLGAGKTTFTQGIARGLGVTQKLISPTFILMREYNLPSNSLGRLYHLDLYRLEKVAEILNLVGDLFSNPNNVILIEWADKIENELPRNLTWIKLTNLGGNKRSIEILETNDS